MRPGRFMDGCKQCGGKGSLTYQLQVVQFPYNPEWDITLRDAGLFCSAKCLATYLYREAGNDTEETS